MDTAAIALIAHELKNALGSLETELATLVREPDSKLALSAHTRCARMRQQFIHFLTLYGSAEPLRAHCEDESPLGLLQAMAQSAIAQAHTAPGAPRLTLLSPPDAPQFWYFDHRLVRLALEAALHNASRFAHSAVTLSLRQDSGFLVFTVDDDGPGLGAPDPSSASTGLGRALCDAVAKAHRCGPREGRTLLKGQAEGGARFELWLP